METEPAGQSSTSPLAGRPYFAHPDRLDDVRSITSETLAPDGLSVGQYRRDRPGFGLTDSNPIAPLLMAVVFLAPLPGHRSWRNDLPVYFPDRRVGSLACFDFCKSWVSDLSHPFHTFHVFIPKRAFCHFSIEIKHPRIEQLSCSNEIDTYDETMLGLAQALGPCFTKPQEATALFVDHVFSAMVAHLATTYGGLKSGEVRMPESRRWGSLTAFQVRRVTEFLLEDLRANPGLSELASLCGLSRSHFVRAFKQATGLPPHRWFLKQRITRAKALLYATKKPISEIAEECGFADQTHLNRVFTKAFGIGPGAWRRYRQD